MGAAKEDILQGWKDIAAYVARDVRTVRRWEKQRGLPVRRTPGEGRANVYALVSELDQWLSHTPAMEGTGVLTEEETVESLPVEAPVVGTAAANKQLPLALAFGFVLASAVFAIALHAHRVHVRSAAASGAVAPPAQHLRYASKVPGVDALYLRGMYFYDRRTQDALPRARQCFLDAIAKDANYAPAWSGLAKTYVLLSEYSVMPPAEAFPKAREAAQRALTLDPGLTEAHAALGFVDFFWSWDGASADREFRTATTLDPNDAMAHSWWGSMLTRQRRFDEALHQFDLAQRLDPESTTIVGNRAYALGLNGHRNEAVDTLLEVGNGSSSAAIEFQIASLSLIEPRNIPLYLDQTRRLAEFAHDDVLAKEMEAGERAYRTSSETAMWKAMLEIEKRAHPGSDNASERKADLEAVLGERDAALRDIGYLVQRHDAVVINIATEPMLVSLHHDPRFERLVAAVGLPAAP